MVNEIIERLAELFMKKIYDIFFRGSEVALWDDISENWPLVLSVVLVLVAIIAVCVILIKKKKSKAVANSVGEEQKPLVKKPLFDIRSLSFAAMCLAVGFVLSFIKIVDLPQGGGITPVSMLPVILFAYIYGPKRGFLVSFVYFLLQLLQGVYFLNVVQFCFDYLFAFALIGVAGFIKKNILLGAIAAHLVRYASHVIAAYAFFREFNQTGINDTAYCLIYNSFVLIEMVACVIILLIPPVKKGIEKIKRNLQKTVR
jgi:thiamine transporter